MTPVCKTNENKEAWSTLPRDIATEPQGSEEPSVKTTDLSHGPHSAQGKTGSENRRDRPKDTHQVGSRLLET